jgi:hypothetical protein
MIGSSCVPNAPMSQGQWEAFTKMNEQHTPQKSVSQ